MDWGQHISDISSKATKTLGFLRRNLAFAPRSTKEVAYKTLVCPKVEYAAPIGAHIVKLRLNKWRRYRGRRPAGPAGGGATLVVLARCLMSLMANSGGLEGPILSAVLPQDSLWDIAY